MGQRTKVFFDVKFTGLLKDTKLISIGLVKESGITFYAESLDYDKNTVDPWIMDNVLSRLKYNKTDCPQILLEKGTENIIMLGTCEQIKRELLLWLSGGLVEMWSDCPAYDWVVFCNLFGGALSLPKNIYYIPFDICTIMKTKGIDPDINREEYAGIDFLTEKHNALHDAKIIMMCYNKLTNPHITTDDISGLSDRFYEVGEDTIALYKKMNYVCLESTAKIDGTPEAIPRVIPEEKRTTQESFGPLPTSDDQVDEKVVERKEEIKVNQVDQILRTWFNLAKRGLLLDNFSEWSLCDGRGWTVAHEAALYGNLPITFRQWELADNNGRSVAHISVKIKSLPKNFDRWDLKDNSDWTVAHEAAKYGRLPKKFVRWNLTNKEGMTVAHVAANSGHIPDDIVDNSSFWRLSSPGGWTVAHEAAKCGTLPKDYGRKDRKMWELCDDGTASVAYVAARFGNLPEGFDNWEIVMRTGGY